MRILMTYVWSPYTTAAYLAKAFRELGHDVRSVGPINCQHNVPERQWYRLGPAHWIGGWGDWEPDVLVWVEAGGGWCPDLSGHSIPTIGWFIDNHSRWAEHVKCFGRFSKAFVAQREYAGAFEDPAAHWLPVACDPEVHTPRVREAVHDVAFVGNTYGDSPLYAERRRLLDLLHQRYDVRQVSGAYFEDIADVYGSARVAFNVSTGGDLNMRVFEAMCSSTPLVTDLVEGLPFWCLRYRDDARLLESVGQLLKLPHVREKMAEEARAEVLAHHTYRHRAERMLEGI